MVEDLKGDLTSESSLSSLKCEVRSSKSRVRGGGVGGLGKEKM